MTNNDANILLEIGMYDFSEEFYFLYKENKNPYDSIFLQGLLFAEYLFQVNLEIENSLHSQNYLRFLNTLNSQEVEILTREKKDFPIFNSEDASPEDIHFFLELEYSEERHNFSFEAQGNWPDPDLYKLDIVNSSIEFISFLGKKNQQINSFYDFITEIANNSSVCFTKTTLNKIAIKEDLLMIVIIAYDNLLKNTTVI